MFRFKLIIFLIISVFSQAKCYNYVRETSHRARASSAVHQPSDHGPHYTMLTDGKGHSFKFWPSDHHENAAASSSGDGDMTAVIQEGDLIALQGTRPRRLHEDPSWPTVSKHPRPPHVVVPTTTTSSERPKTVERHQTDNDEDPSGKIVGQTSATSTARTTHEIPADATTTLKPHRKPTTASTASPTTFHPAPTTTDRVTDARENPDHVTPQKPGTADAAGSLLESWPTTVVPASDLDGRDSECDAAGPTTSDAFGVLEAETDVGDGPADSCDGRDEFVLVVENDIKLKLTVDSKRASEKRSVGRDDGNDDPPCGKGEEKPADAECTETDKKPGDGSTYLRIKPRRA